MRKATLAIVGFLAVATGAEAGLHYNGTQINGTQINGTQINGTQINGTQINGTQINGTQINGTQISGTQLYGTQLYGTLIGATPSYCPHVENATGYPMSWCSSCAQIVSNYDAHCGSTWWDSACVSEAQSMCSLTTPNFVGSVWTANMKDGTTMQLKVNGVQQLSGNNSDVFVYDLRYQSCRWVYNMFTGSSTWQCSWNQVCPSQTVCNSAGTICTTFGAGAIPVRGAWDGTNPGGKDPGTDSSSITFSCRNGAIAKCVEYEGYKPWHWYQVPGYNSSGQEQYYWVYGDNFHQSCVRMLRADYCGDGNPHTMNETPIDVVDAAGVQYNDNSETTPEAQWTPRGAQCATTWRYNSLEQQEVDTYGYVQCAQGNGQQYSFTYTNGQYWNDACFPGFGGLQMLVNASTGYPGAYIQDYH